MKDKNRVIELIESGHENDFCDFKIEYYSNNKKADLIKDVVAFANNTVYGDKYIIFNVDDKTRQLGEMRMDSVPDISEINGLLREYCEPHIGVKLDTMSYKNKVVAYIKIPVECNDRPYVIRKDFSREGKMYLQQGQIFIRKNSDNFKANRMDLDAIYESRIKRKLDIYNSKILEKEKVINNRVERFFLLDFVFCNDAKENFLIEEIKVFFKFKEHAFTTSVKKIYDNDYNNDDKIVIIDMPFSVEPFSSIQKSLYFELSSNCIEQIKIRENNCELMAWIEIQDIKKRKIYSEPQKCSMIFI